MGVEDSNESAALLALVYDIEHIPSVAAQPVKPRNHELVALSQEFDDGC
jgi:hypothetical protein